MVERLDRLLYAALRFNPCVTWHELRLRMRVGRAFVLLALYVLFAAGAVVIPVGTAVWQRQHFGGTPGTDLGRVGLHALVYVQLTLIFVALPAFAAATIASERERETLEMLRATLLSPWDVVTGKLLSVLALGVVLLGTSLPIAAWCLLLGGVSPTEVFRVYMLMLAVAAGVSTLGLLMSAQFHRALGAIVATYGTLLGLVAVIGVGAYVVFAWIAIASAAHYTSLGVTAAVVLVGMPVLVTAILLTMLVRWIASRLLLLRVLTARSVFSVVVGIVLVGALLIRAAPLIEKMSNASPAALTLVIPYVGAASTLEESVGRSVIGSSTPSGTTRPVADLQGYVWSILMWVYLAIAGVLWVGATRVYARRTGA